MVTVDDEHASEAARQRRIADACLDANGPVTGRLAVYRRLVQGNLAAVARRLLPRTAAALDAQDAGAFERCFARFLAEAAPRTPYLRDIASELVQWAGPGWEGLPNAPHVADLARYEVDVFQLGSALSEPARDVVDVAVGRGLVFATPSRLVHYRYAVHEPALSATPDDAHLLLHRDAANVVQTTRLDPDAARIVELALLGATLGDALSQAHGGAPPTEKDLLDVARALADLGASGALLGGAA